MCAVVDWLHIAMCVKGEHVYLQEISVHARCGRNITETPMFLSDAPAVLSRNGLVDMLAALRFGGFAWPTNDFQQRCFVAIPPNSVPEKN